MSRTDSAARHWRRGVTGLLLLLNVLPAVAADPPSYDRVQLQVAVEQEVDNDEVVVTLAVELDEQDAARLADTINQRMQAALEAVASRPTVRARTGNYSIRPVYSRDNRFDHWQGSQQLLLESSDSQAVAALLKQLQETLRVKSIRYGVSSARRDQVEDELTTRALARFRERAGLIAAGLGFADYRLVELAVRPSGSGPQPMYSLALEARAASPVEHAPALEGGWSDLRIEVSGTIELQAGR